MRSGDVIGARFEIQARVGAGAIGTVYRARDRADGALVAVKAMRDADHSPRRFAREAQVLREDLAAILLGTGDVAAAEAEARRGVALLSASPPLRPQALAMLARVLGHTGRHDEALGAAREAMEAVVAGYVEEGQGLILLVYAEACDAAARRDDALRAIESARDRLLARAAKISDESRRRSFLENIPEHARTLELAGAWLDDGPAADT